MRSLIRPAFFRSKTAQVATAVTALVISGAAAATPGGGFDSAPILADIATYLAAALLLIGTFIAAGWAIHSLGLLKRKG